MGKGIICLTSKKFQNFFPSPLKFTKTICRGKGLSNLNKSKDSSNQV